MTSARSTAAPAELARVPWWGVASAVAAPVLLITGWTVAAELQPQSYDAVRQTVSVLAAHGAADRWVMTLAFYLVGVCDVITALALRPAARPGRLVLLAGGAAGMLVGVFPESIGQGASAGHVFFAGLGFILLSVWPLAAAGLGELVPWALRPLAGASASAVTIALFGWFLAELVTGGGQLGLAERAVGEMQALWPLVTVVSCLLAGREPGSPGSRPDLRTQRQLR